MKAYIILALALVMVGSASAVEKISPLSFIPIDENIQSTLPKGTYSVDSIIRYTTDPQPNPATSSFLSVLSNGASDDRQKIIPMSKRISRVNGVLCSETPDATQAYVSLPTTTQTCYTNPNDFPIVMRIYDFAGNIRYLGEVSVEAGAEGCIGVEPDHQYLLDVLNCEVDECSCEPFTPVECRVAADDNFYMLLERACEPAGCAVETTTTEWINEGVNGCNKVTDRCRETDGGMDYANPGKSKSLTDSATDTCINERLLKEYYCSNGEIFSAYHYCSEGQSCVNNACVTVTDATCGLVDNKWRYQDDAWCVGTTKKVCDQGRVESEMVAAECSLPTCDYHGLILNEGDKVCMGDGKTIAQCKPGTTENFIYSSCQEDTQCVRNSEDTNCRDWKVNERRRMTVWSIMDLINKLLQR